MHRRARAVSSKPSHQSPPWVLSTGAARLGEGGAGGQALREIHRDQVPRGRRGHRRAGAVGLGDAQFRADGIGRASESLNVADRGPHDGLEGEVRDGLEHLDGLRQAAGELSMPIHWRWRF